jgi:hypothetical protein
VRRLTPVLLLVALTSIPASLLADELAYSRAKLVLAIQELRAALERVRGFDEAAVVRARREIERRRELLPRGIISRRDVDESERALAAAEQKLEDTGRQIREADQAIMEILTDPRMARRHASPERPDGVMLVRNRGFVRWSLTETPKIQSFFARRFGRPLPISAFGQTPLHDRLGFDHHEAVDIALLPDSVEGTALMAYLRDAGISFLAYRGGVPGEATGAHIHIGEASRRLAPQAGGHIFQSWYQVESAPTPSRATDTSSR